MDDSIPRSIAIIILILSSGFFAAAETAFSYCNQVRINMLAEDGDKKAKRVVKLLENNERTVVTLLIAINVLHVIAASISAVMAVELFGDIGSVISTVVITLITFMFAEMIPKNIARENADSFIAFSGTVITWFYYLFYPFASLFLLFGDWVKRITRIENGEPTITEDEFASIVEDVEDEGLIEPEETEIIKSAIEFGDLTAQDIMCKREDMVCIPINAENDVLKEYVLEEKYSRFPVYDGNIDHIIGVLQSRVCLWHFINHKEFKMNNLITRPFFVAPETPIRDIFEQMGKKRTHLAIVRTTDGKNIGLLTMEDILEEIVGEIYDEDDESVPMKEGVE